MCKKELATLLTHMIVDTNKNDEGNTNYPIYRQGLFYTVVNDCPCFNWNSAEWSGETCEDNPVWTPCGCNTCIQCGSGETKCYANYPGGSSVEIPCEFGHHSCDLL